MLKVSPHLVCWAAPLILLSGAVAGDSIDFNRDIRPILSNKCIACHGPDEETREAGLRLDTREGAMMDLGGYYALVPEDAEDSELIYRVVTDDPIDIMPPPGKGKPLSPEEIELLTRWIDQGGTYAKHWSYEAPQRAKLPEVETEAWQDHPVDRFLADRLEREGLSPSPQADRLTLARRLSIDLTGLPPTWEEAEYFANDPSVDAYDHYVDHLLAKPAYGERWARVWLDLARYADSAGYADDRARTIWAYRDYVIQAYNENKPFDQFTIEQIAGDLLPEPTESQLIATAFHRNTLTNNEGGTNDEEFRNVAVVDRVNTTMSVWMGTTMACAQCHTHKYDPLTHAEYFQLFDFFNQSADADRRDESPLIEIWTDQQQQEKHKLTEQISKLKARLATSTPEIAAERERWLAKWEAGFRWSEQAPAKMSSTEGASFELVDQWLQASSEVETDAYTLAFDTAPLGDQPLTGLRLAVSADQSRNFVLSQLRAKFTPHETSSPVARYVRVELPGQKKTLQIAEVEVLAGGTNIAVGKTTTHSSVYTSATSARAVDGKTEGDYHKGSVFHSKQEDTPWIEIDFEEMVAIDSIRIWNRTDGGDPIQKRIEGYEVVLLDADRNEITREKPGTIPKPSDLVALSGVRWLPFALATASHEQKGFPATAAIADETSKETGWAIAGGVGDAQELIAVFANAFQPEPGSIEVTLDQSSKYPNHLLETFRVDFSNDPKLSQWAKIPPSLRRLVEKGSALSPEDAEKLEREFLTIAPSLTAARRELAKAEKTLSGMSPSTTVPVMRDLPAEQHRETHIHLRGSYLSHGEQVKMGTPAVFHPMREDLPTNRLGLAHWLIDEANPLTARVIANRYWEQLFGIGIVATSEEFGAQGEAPSHPELLDWLALELIELGWDMKAFTRLLVTSQAYQQHSRVTPAQLERDPDNRLLARGPRFRISAEMVRDQALALAGLLSAKRYGPPVNPPQPELGLKAAFGAKTDWVTSEGEDRYRRGIYTTWRRSSPYPSMATFDAPNREVCTVRRTRTNTPLQALVTLNDPVYVEAAQAWAREALTHPGDDGARLRLALRRSLTREPTEAEINRLLALLEQARAYYAGSADEAAKMAQQPLGDLPAELDLTDAAAWTTVGNVVLNLDELFLKR
ncbi:MAG: DUF1553 domain-containing protein [Verrucomicrobiota bacterium]